MANDSGVSPRSFCTLASSCSTLTNRCMQDNHCEDGGGGEVEEMEEMEEVEEVEEVDGV